MKIAFVGTVIGSRVALNALYAAGRAPAVVITLPPSAARRHSDYADLAEVAEPRGTPVVTTGDINGAVARDAIRDAGADIALVVGWSQICGEAFRSTTPMGAVGYHPAPLPRMRGRAVIPWTILAGEAETASTLFVLDEGVDSGPILAQEPIQVAPDETATTLYEKHISTLARMLPPTLEAIENGHRGTPQDESAATWCAKRIPDDGLVDWRLPADDVLRLVRAVAPPYPGAFSVGPDGKVGILRARPFPDGKRYLGLPGQVQALTDEGFVVRCGDGECIEVTEWTGAARPRMHVRLNGGAA